MVGTCQAFPARVWCVSSCQHQLETSQPPEYLRMSASCKDSAVTNLVPPPLSWRKEWRHLTIIRFSIRTEASFYLSLLYTHGWFGAFDAPEQIAASRCWVHTPVAILATTTGVGRVTNGRGFLSNPDEISSGRGGDASNFDVGTAVCGNFSEQKQII